MIILISKGLVSLLNIIPIFESKLSIAIYCLDQIKSSSPKHRGQQGAERKRRLAKRVRIEARHDRDDHGKKPNE